jgi:hypothetical protein
MVTEQHPSIDRMPVKRCGSGRTERRGLRFCVRRIACPSIAPAAGVLDEPELREPVEPVAHAVALAAVGRVLAVDCGEPALGLQLHAGGVGR